MSGFKTFGTVEIVRGALQEWQPMVSPAMTAKTLMDDIFNLERNPFLENPLLALGNLGLSTPDLIECLTILERGYNR